ncbi:MAG: outer membrane lipoprotein carrier protein LolA [Bacteroidales bacterium]|jgi:hypothetical protein|nr:outer membrane lipoprotein carrier protein LolA [Bacteroidales bacterium]
MKNTLARVVAILILTITNMTLFATPQSASSASPQSASPESPQSSADRLTTVDLLKKMRSALKQTPAVEFSFELIAKDESGDLSGDFKGVIYSQGYAFKMVNPELELFCDGETKWILNSSMMELTIIPNDTTQTDLVENPVGFLTSLEGGKSGYNFAVRPKEGTNHTLSSSKVVWLVELTPVNRWMAYKSVTIGIDKVTSLPLFIEYLAKDGSKYTALIKSVKHLSGLPSATFVFPEARKKGLVVTDLR